MASKRVVKLKKTDRNYSKIRAFAKELYIQVDMTGTHLSFPKIAKKIEHQFSRKVSAETVRNWSKEDKWSDIEFQVVESVEKRIEVAPDKIEDGIAFLADMVKMNDYMWKKASKMITDYLKSDALDVKDALFLLKFTTDNKLRFEEFKLSLLKKRVEIERDQLFNEKLRGETGAGEEYGDDGFNAQIEMVASKIDGNDFDVIDGEIVNE